MRAQQKTSVGWQEAISEFLIDRPDLSDSTRKRYADLIQWFGALAGVPVNQVGRLHILKCLQRYSNARTYNTTLSLLKTFFGWAAEFYRFPDPARSMRMKKLIDDTAPTIITDMQYARIVAAKGIARNRAVFLANTGLRATEFCTLRIIDARTISILGKGGKRRIVPLNKTAAGLLPVLKLSKSKDALYKCIHQLGDRCGIDHLHPHSLRHYFATKLVQRANIADVSKLLGHASVNTTIKYYYHADDLRSVVETLDK